MNTTNNNSLSISYEHYKDALIKKIKDIEKILTQEINDEKKFHLLYENIHQLYELADTNNDIEIIKILNEIDISTQSNKLHQNIPQFEKVETMIKKTNTFLAESSKFHEEYFYKQSKNINIYILDNDIEFATYLKSQLYTFDYNVKIFSYVDSFFSITHQHRNRLALLINIDLLNQELEKFLIALKANTEWDVQIFFMSSKGDVLSRLKAIRLKGCAYLIKPFLTQEFVMRLERVFHHQTEGPRILIIDDDPDTAQIFSILLTKAGMKCQTVTHYARALHVLSEFNPDLILLDIYMTYCSGLELAAIIRQQSAYDSTPIIFLSSEDNTLKQLNAMSMGGDEFVTKFIKPEFLIQTIRNKISRYQILRESMVFDGLTGVYNHANILQQLAVAIKLADRVEKPLSIAMIDLDNFKHVNDRYGHIVGDHVLRNFCLLLRRRLRASDIIGRYGGEEFLVIFPNTNYIVAKKVIEILKDQFSDFSHHAFDESFNVAFSAGIASFPHYKSITEILQAADRALYIAKSRGKNRVHILT